MTEAVQTRQFDAKIDSLLNLMVNALYSNKEIFLRELVSNASDALDKLRFSAYKDSALYENDSELRIRVSADKDARQIIIEDNGIGMSEAEVIENLGTIANSGTKSFLENLTGDSAKDAQLIGQFGVGFYSSFIIADSVTVETRRAGADAADAVRWQSEGRGEYTLESIEKAERGTRITLHLKADEDEFLNGMRLRHIITRYSDHIGFPVIMPSEPTPEFDEEGKVKPESVEKAAEDEVVNRATALWTLPKSDIKTEDYQSFYKHISHDFEEAATWAHNKVEGKTEYTSLLYIPKKAPYDLWNADKSAGLKLYVKRVFIMDEAEQLLPRYLRFVKGIIDSNDLPLNVSREILQNSKIVESIKSGVTKRVLSMLEDMAKNDAESYQAFWKEFGLLLKEGPAEDFANQEKVGGLLRFASTHNDSDAQVVCLEDYVSRMQEGQKKIYYVAADSWQAAKNSPHLEAFKAKGIEVLLLSDRIDEWMLSHYTSFKELPFQSVAKGSMDDLNFNEEAAEEQNKSEEALNEAHQPLLERCSTALSERVKKVRMTSRLTESPACIVADEHDMTRQMERLLKSAGQKVDFKPILELNPEHVLVKKLEQISDTESFQEWSHLLLEQAIVAEGGQLEDPASFVKRFNKILLSLAK
jgi:molecular chaperone HtpG